MSTQEIYTERQWTKEETDLLPFGYEPNKNPHRRLRSRHCHI
jgi:hypothetical protein